MFRPMHPPFYLFYVALLPSIKRQQQAVEHNAFMPRHSERLGAMAADIAGASGDQDTCHGGDVDEDEIGIFCRPGVKSRARDEYSDCSESSRR